MIYRILTFFLPFLSFNALKVVKRKCCESVSRVRHCFDCCKNAESFFQILKVFKRLLKAQKPSEISGNINLFLREGAIYKAFKTDLKIAF